MTFLGDHTKRVRSGISIGFLLFIISEAFAFFSVFWSFFHSALSPSIEIGGIWPPFGLTTLNSFGLPLTNTVLLLSSGAYVTLAHHALIGKKRKTSLDGSFVTLILAVLFTLYQGIEYNEASFSFSDSVFGTVFFASTGLHGLIKAAPTNYINNTSIFKARLAKQRSRSSILHYLFTSFTRAYLDLNVRIRFYFYLVINKVTFLPVVAAYVLLLGVLRLEDYLCVPAERSLRCFASHTSTKIQGCYAEAEGTKGAFLPYGWTENQSVGAEGLYLRSNRANSNKLFYLNIKFLQWLAGFTDAEGNFNISLRNFKDNKYNSVIITFQIGLHIDDLPVLNYIQTNLNCGHISVSGNKCNYFVNDQYSLINIISPIFNHIQLNSSKYYQFLVFEKAVNLIKDKKHLSSEGKLKIIKYYHEIKNSNLISKARNKKDIFISDY